VKLLTGGTGYEDAGENAVVINSGTRDMDATKAAGKVREILLHGGYRNDMKLFMKTDSLLRGNVESELLAVLSATAYTSCLLVPANPSKQRVIRQGNYYVDNILLAETEYRNDPEYPRTTSDVAELLASGSGSAETADLSGKKLRNRIMVPDVTSVDDLRGLTRAGVQDDVLSAGGADYFRELLIAEGHSLAGNAPVHMEYPTRKCFLLGSYAMANRSAVEVLQRKKYSHVVLKLPDRFIGDPVARASMLGALVETAASIAVASKDPVLFLVTGGKTASLFCDKMNWNRLTVLDVHDTGIITVRDKESNHLLTMKPGSYDWPDFLLK
jgi:hypothetical protein